MITAIDTSVLLDVLGGDATYGPASAAAIRDCSREGSLIACDVVWAELSSMFEAGADAGAALARLGVDFSAITRDSALAAGDSWREYRRRGGTRTRLVADFLVGAHAAQQADRLLTRDRGFYRSYFTDLEVVDPTGAS